MGCFGRSIPWISVSKGWISPSKACFRWKNRPETCHIVAKKPLCGPSTRSIRTDVFHNQAFLIFAYLQATEQSRENNRFSVLKSSCGGQSSMAAQGKGCPPRRDAIHRVSHRPHGPPQGKNVGAGLRPGRVRRDESRLYAGKFPCGRIPTAG